MIGGFAWISVPLLAVSLGAGAPGAVGAAHLFITALAAAMLTCGVAVLTGRYINVAATAVTLCALGGVVAAARMWRPVPAQWLGMCTLVILLFLLTLSPTIALWSARIRPPYFGSVTGRDLFRRSAGLPVDAVSPVDEAAEEEMSPDTTPRGAQIAAAAVRANNVLTGICVGASLALPAAVWATLMPGHHRSGYAVVLAGLFVLIFISRGRAFADKRQAIALVFGLPRRRCVGVIKYVWHAPAAASDAVLWGALLLAGFGARGFGGGPAGADHQVHPIGADDRRMAGDRGDHRGVAAGRVDWRVVQLGAHAMTRRVGAAADLRPRRSSACWSRCRSTLPAAQAIPPPSVDPGRVPPDGKPGPDQPMRQSNICARTITVAEPNVAVTAPGFTLLNVSKAWQYSTGNGVPVAVIDTGVNPTPRLPVVPGGDYIMGGDGLMDCDSHGTVVASLIAAAPQGIPMPAPMPAAPAFPPPAGPPPADCGTAAAGRTAAADRATAAAVAGDDHRNQTGSAAAATAAPAGRAVERAGRSRRPAQPDDPEVPPPPPGAPDGVAGVAPHARIISIRQSSRAYEPETPGGGDMEARKKAGTIATLASAIVHAANMGAKVINISVTACVSAADPLDQSAIGAAVWYAATVKDAVIVAAAGNEGEDECAQNPGFDPLDAATRATGIRSRPSRRRRGSPTTCCPSAPSTTPALRSARACPGRGWPPRRPASGSWACPRRPADR